MGLTLLRRSLALRPDHEVFTSAAAPSDRSTLRVAVEAYSADADVLCVGAEPFVWYACEQWEITSSTSRATCVVGAGYQPSPHLSSALSDFRSSVLRVRGVDGISAMAAFKVAHQHLNDSLRCAEVPSRLPSWYFATLSGMGATPLELATWDDILRTAFGPSTTDVEHYSVWATVPPEKE